MMRPLGITPYLAAERVERFRHEAEAARLTAEARREQRTSRLAAPEGAVTIRLDRAGDASRLYQLAALSGERLAPGPFVVAEVDGSVAGAMPLAGGPTVLDPCKPIADLQPLLELQVARVGGRNGTTQGAVRRFRRPWTALLRSRVGAAPCS